MNTLYAVITGDIVGFTKLGQHDRQHLIEGLKEVLMRTERRLGDAVYAPFSVHRGDSFQGVLRDPSEALRATLTVRADLRQCVPAQAKPVDTRTAIGVGTVDYLPAGRAGEGDGEAFRRSGPELDRMKGTERTRISTPWNQLNHEFAVSCALLDALVLRWSAEQAEATSAYLWGMTQTKIAELIGITQPAVRERLHRAGAWAIIQLETRYKHCVNTKGGL